MNKLEMATALLKLEAKINAVREELHTWDGTATDTIPLREEGLRLMGEWRVLNDAFEEAA